MATSRETPVFIYVNTDDEDENVIDLTNDDAHPDQEAQQVQDHELFGDGDWVHHLLVQTCFLLAISVRKFTASGTPKPKTFSF